MSASDYWKGVGNKLLSIGKTVLKAAAPVAIDAAVQIALEKACDFIQKKLKTSYLKTARNAAITLAANILGILIVVLKPFGNVASSYVGSVFFIGAFVFYIVRTVLFWKNNGKTIFSVGKNILTEKNIEKGVEAYIMKEVPLVAAAYYGIELVSIYLPDFKKIPKIPETVRYIFKTFWKQLALFGGIVAVYTISVYWILKPLLLKNFGGLTWYQLYFFPIYHTIQLFK